jgi:hypothetical protein
MTKNTNSPKWANFAALRKKLTKAKRSAVSKEAGSAFGVAVELDHSTRPGKPGKGPLRT